MIIWGFRSRNKVLGQASYVCQQCHKNSYHTFVRTQRWFTLFFIPIFPFRTTVISRCNMCGIQLRVPKERAEALLAAPVQQPAQPLASQVPPMSVPPQPPSPGAAYQSPASYYDNQLKNDGR